MDRIEISPNDKKDLLELLDYAKIKKQEDDNHKDKRDHWVDSNYWKIRIEQLKMIIKGYVPTPHIQSSMQTFDKHLNKKEMRRLREDMQSEIIDLMDYFEEKKGEDSLYT